MGFIPCYADPDVDEGKGDHYRVHRRL
jgi:hypothetical protein